MSLDPTQPIPSDDTPAPSFGVDKAGSAPRQGEQQDAQGTHPPTRLTLDALQVLAEWARKMKARNAQSDAVARLDRNP